MAQDLSINIVAIDKTTAAFRSVSAGLGNISASAGALTSKIAAVTAALSALGGVASIRGVINVADSLDELSARSGIAVETLSSLANTAKFAGVSQEELAGALVRLNKAIAEAASGSKEQIAAFDNLGVSFRNADGSVRPVVEVLGDVASAFSGAETNAIKTQYAMALFGKSGANLIEFLDKGQIGIQEISNTIDDKFAKSAASFNDNLDLMGLRVQGFLGNRLSPYLEWINKQFDKIAEADKASKAWSGAAGGGRGFVNPDRVTPMGPKTSLKPLATGPSEAEKEAAKLLEETRKSYESIADEINKLIYGEDELLIIQFQRRNNDATALEHYKALIAERRKLLNLDKELEDAGKEADKYADEAAEKKKKLLDEAKRLYDETRTPLENFNIEMARLDDLLAKGYINWDVYSRATLDAMDKLDMFKEKGQDSFASLESAVRGWGNQFTDTMANAVMSGKLSFKDLANSVISDLMRMMIYQSITKPLFSAMGFSLDGARAMGGPVTSGKSYLVGENGPEIFTPGSSGGITPNGGIGGSVSVNIVNNSGAAATAKESVDSRGNRRIDVVVGDLVAKEISRIGSNANQAIRTTFQTSPALAGR